MFLFMPRKSPFAHPRSPRVFYISSDPEGWLVRRGFATQEKRSLLPPLLAILQPQGSQGSCWRGVWGVPVCSAVLLSGVLPALPVVKKPLYASASVCTHLMGYAPTLWVTHALDKLCMHLDGLCILPTSYTRTPWLMHAPHGLCTHHAP